MYDPPGMPPPGWYPDPERPGASRWWSGTEWAAPMWTTAWSPAPTAADALPDVSKMISGAFRRALRRWRALVVLGVVGGALPTALVLLAIRRTLDGLAIVDEEVVGWSSDRIPGVVALVAGSVVLGWIGTLAIAWLMLRTYDEEMGSQGQPAERLSTAGELSTALTALLRAGVLLPRAVLWLAALAIGWLAWLALLVGAFVLAWPLGLLLLLASIPLFVWLAAKLAFVVQALVDRPGMPFGRSWLVSHGRFWPVFGRVLLALVIASAINYGAGAIRGIAITAEVGFGTSGAYDLEEAGEIRDERLDEVFPFGPVTITGAALAAIVTAVLATSTLMVALSELYRTRNAPPP